MTPLHWAAYNDDPGVVAYLLKQGSKMQFSATKSTGYNATPVDVAGLRDHEDVVYIFVKWIEAQVAKEMIEL